MVAGGEAMNAVERVVGWSVVFAVICVLNYVIVTGIFWLTDFVCVWFGI